MTQTDDDEEAEALALFEQQLSEIIRLVREPVWRGKRHSRGPDLSSHRDKLRGVIGDTWKAWRAACDEYEAKDNPSKPRERLEENWDDEPSPHDYGEYAGMGFNEPWEVFWKRHYYRGGGRPRRGRTSLSSGSDLPLSHGGPPTEALGAAYHMLGDFWVRTTLKPWHPEFPKEYDEEDEQRLARPKGKGPRRDSLKLMTASGRLFYLVAKWMLDERYTGENCWSAADTYYKTRRSRERTQLLRQLKARR